MRNQDQDQDSRMKDQVCASQDRFAHRIFEVNLTVIARTKWVGDPDQVVGMRQSDSPINMLTCYDLYFTEGGWGL